MAVKKAKKTVKKSTAKKPVAKVTTVKAVAKKSQPAKTGFKGFVKKVNVFTTKHRVIICASVAEFIGTFMFVTFYMGTQGDPRYAMFALIGISLIIGGLTGAAVNPALTIANWITRKVRASHTICYIVAQALGGVAAWSLLSAFAKGTAAATVDAMSAAPATVFKATALTTGKEWFIFFAELLGAAILAFGFATAMKMKKDKVVSALAYGFALFIAMFITYIIVSPLGTGLVFFNPAIAFAASGISFKLWPIAIYVFAPIIGAVAGLVLHEVSMSVEVEAKK